MKNKNYKKAPKNISSAIEASKIIEDFLPSPDKLIDKEETIKTTIDLSKKSVFFFKIAAKKNHTSYQKMVRKVVDLYVNHYDK